MNFFCFDHLIAYFIKQAKNYESDICCVHNIIFHQTMTGESKLWLLYILLCYTLLHSINVYT